MTTTVANDDGPQEVLVDVLLRARAYYIKKAPGGSGQVSWKKHGGPTQAWVKTMHQAVVGRERAA